MRTGKKSTAIVISANGMSQADEELSKTLLANYLKLIEEEELIPNAILLYGEGVKAVTEGSPFLEAFSKLEKKGVKLIVCKTCLNFYGLLDKTKIGIVGTMTDIIHYQWSVDKVVTL
jgi:intracellular sulfur oxidation DsrE/DsrF family protein